MFSLEIVDTDAFLEMPPSTQALYFHLGMRADDDGFISNPKKIMRVLGSSEDDMRILIAKRFILSFESGVMVVKHWRINNFIRTDRYHETKYVEEKKGLEIKENGSYTEKLRVSQPGIPMVYQMDTEVRLGKVRLGKVRRERDVTASPYASLTYLKTIPDEDMQEYIENFSANKQQIETKALQLYDYCESKGKKYKNYKAFLRNALRSDYPKKEKVKLLSELISGL